MTQLRFRYFDAAGKERHVDAPEQLADAVERGHIVASTLIWDSHEGGWVRAEEHDATSLAIAARLAMGYDPKQDLAAGRNARGGGARHDSGRRRPLPKKQEGVAKRLFRRVLTLALVGVGAVIAYEILALIAI